MVFEVDCEWDADGNRQEPGLSLNQAISEPMLTRSYVAMWRH